MGYYKKIPVEERSPAIGKVVTIIDSSGDHWQAYKTVTKWMLRDAIETSAPMPALPFTHWLEKVEEPNNMEFELAARPLIKYLCENHHPHVSVHVTNTSAELSEGIKVISNIHDYLQ